MEEYYYYPVGNKGYIRVRSINGEILPHYIIDNKFSAKFSGYRLISKDLLNIKEALSQLLTIKYYDNIIISQSLSFMIIITYGKCFAKADGRKIKLEKESALKNFTAEELKIHEEIIILRNQYIAHGGVSKFETNPVIITRTSSSDGSYGYMAHDSCVYMSTLTLNLPLITSFLTKIIEFVDEKIDVSFTNLMKFIITKMPEKEFEDNSFIPDTKKMMTLKDIQ